jgi:hypothetical protein
MNDKDILEEATYITKKELQFYFIFGAKYPEVGKRLDGLLEMAKDPKTKQIIQNLIKKRNNNLLAKFKMRYLIVNKKDFTAIEEDAASYTTFAEAHAEMLSCLNFNDLTIVRSFDCGENFTEYYDRNAQIWRQTK